MKKIILLLLFAGILVGLYYSFFSGDDWEGTFGIPVSISDEQKYAEKLSDKDIEEFLFYNLPDRVITPEFGGKVFCANQIYGSDKNYKENLLDIYAYSFCEEYYLKDRVVTLGTGISTPLKITFAITRTDLTFKSVSIPNLGSDYNNSLLTVFPQKILPEVRMQVDTKTLIPLPKTQAENYYKGKLEVYF